MNELLAIVLIVIICCAIFFAWLFSMAACPDQIINFLNGTSNNTTCSTSYESKELISKEEKQEEPTPSAVGATATPAQNASMFQQLTGIARRSNSKKLSVVPEQDEQCTVTSISQILFPLRQPNNESGVPVANPNSEHIQQLEARFIQIHNEEGPDAVVVIDGNQHLSDGLQEEHQHLGHLPVRFHYSAPAIHVA